VNRKDAEHAESEANPKGPEPDDELNALSHRVIGAAIEVHRRLGAGYLEGIYEQAMAIELAHREIPFRRQVTMHIEYRGHAIGESRLDLLVAGRLVVELKAVETLAPIHGAQVLSYLKVGGFRLGLLINFNVRMLTRGVHRFILTP
jgi:GxxExxY protein